MLAQLHVGLGLHFASGGIQVAVVQFHDGALAEIKEFSRLELADHGDVAADLYATTRDLETKVEILRGRGRVTVGLKATEPSGLVQSGLSADVCRRLYLQGSVLEMLSHQGLRPKIFLKQAYYGALGLPIPKKGNGQSLDDLRRDRAAATTVLGVDMESSLLRAGVGEERFMALVSAVAAARTA
ncbi:hypothetical protein [Deinococcus yunweiensis]|uniref:hypothetical protein n=1 Tax=Deinococcus yunweiensis TaxID=367282 RepID=UPI00398EE485